MVRSSFQPNGVLINTSAVSVSDRSRQMPAHIWHISLRKIKKYFYSHLEVHHRLLFFVCNRFKETCQNLYFLIKIKYMLPAYLLSIFLGQNPVKKMFCCIALKSRHTFFQRFMPTRRFSMSYLNFKFS